ncbi:MAG: type II toxin-antitoxin system PemK/MazF family toxin [Tepidiformaceae bacterium]
MRRGEIWWVEFRGTGAETQKTRPAVLVSNDGANRSSPVLQVVPLTRNVGRLFPWDALLTVNGEQARALCNQIQTADRSRFGERLAVLSRDDMNRVDQALRLQLALT